MFFSYFCRKNKRNVSYIFSLVSLFNIFCHFVKLQ